MNDRQKAALLLAMIAAGSGGVFYFSGGTGYDVGTPPCDLQCDSCSDCTNALNNDSVDYVCLNTSIAGQTGSCINNPVNFSFKTFDCQQYIIDGDDSGTDYGIYLSGKTNNSILNCTITDFSYGIYFSYSYNGTIWNNSVNSNSDGIRLSHSTNNNLKDNFVNSSSFYGIVIESGSDYNNLTNNTVGSNGITGIYMQASPGCYLTNNTVWLNSHTGIFVGASSDCYLTTNNVCENSVYDIYNISSISYGISNTCNITLNWHDIGVGSGCTFLCGVSNCSDGTVDGECSVDRPKYCSGSILVDNCSFCGCSAFSVCNVSDDICYPYCVLSEMGNATAPEGGCFAGIHPWYCLDAETNISVENCSICGCDAGFECLDDGSCGQVCNCTNVSDCRDKIQYCDVVYLLNNISDVSGFLSYTGTELNSVFDCDGYSITGNLTDVCFSVVDVSGLTIRNCTVSNFTAGFFVRDSSHVKLINDYVNLSMYGFYIYENVVNSTFFNLTGVADTSGFIIVSSASSNSVTDSYFCSNDFDFIYFGNNTKSGLTCDKVIPDYEYCDYKCDNLVLSKTVSDMYIYEPANVSYYFNVSNLGECVIVGLNLTDSVLGNINITPIGTNITQTVVYPGEYFIVEVVAEVAGTTLNNATITGTDNCSNRNLEFNASAKVTLLSNILNVTKRTNMSTVNRYDLGGNNKFDVEIEVCGLINISKIYESVDVVFLIENDESIGNYSRGSSIKSSVTDFISTHLNSSKDRVGVVTSKHLAYTEYNLSNSNNFADAKNFVSLISFSGNLSSDVLGWNRTFDMFDTLGGTNEKIVLYFTSENGIVTSNFGSLAVDRNITVYSIGFNNSGLNHNVTILETNKTNGVYYFVSNATNQLNGTFDNVSFNIITELVPDYVNVFDTVEDYVYPFVNSVKVEFNGVTKSNFSASLNNKTLSIVNVTDGKLTYGNCSKVVYSAYSTQCGDELDVETNVSYLVFYNMYDRYISRLDIPVANITVICPIVIGTVEKYSDTDCAFAGMPVAYSFLISNDCNLTLNVSCVDDKIGTFTIGQLLSGETKNKTIYSNITDTTTNSVNCTFCFSDGTCNYSVDSLTVYLAELTVNKTVNQSYYTSSENITYVFNLNNTGDCTLYNVVLYDKINNEETIEIEIGTLNVNESTVDICEYYYG